jgi:hypothetical protein
VQIVGQLISGMTFQSGFFLQVVFERNRDEVHRIIREIVHVVVRGIESPNT